MEMALFLFVRSIRARNFVLYKYAIDQLFPWMFAIYHIHYARWLTIHLYDLNQTNPEIYEEFKDNAHKKSSMGIDHRHEQLNADVKGCASGAVGLTEEEVKFLEWMICGPKEARMSQEFESDNFCHHEDSAYFQSKFKQDVENLESEFISI